MIAVDIGANIGFYSILFSNLVGSKGKVYSFEPDKTNYSYLKENLAKKKNTSIYNLAVGEKKEYITLYLSKYLNVDHRTYKTKDTRMTRRIKCVSLDKFLKPVSKVDIIKIDIQGYDYFAIYGAKELIKKQKKLLIIGEFWPYGLKQAGVEPQDYINLLQKLGLVVKIKLPQPLFRLEKNKFFYTDFIAYK